MSMVKKLQSLLFLIFLTSNVFALDVPEAYSAACWEKGDNKITRYLNKGYGAVTKGDYGKSCGCMIAKKNKEGDNWISIGWTFYNEPYKKPAKSTRISCFDKPSVKLNLGEDFRSCTDYFSDETRKELNSIILKSVSEYGGCPTQEGYDLIFETAQREWDKQAVEAAQKKREDETRHKEMLKFLNTVCKGIPRIQIHLIESMANELNVNPRSISLERVQLDTSVYPSCSGTFYSPKGSLKRVLGFDSSGVINYLGISY